MVSGENINTQVFYRSNRGQQHRRDNAYRHSQHDSNNSLPRSGYSRGRGRGSYNSLPRSSTNIKTDYEGSYDSGRRQRGRGYGSRNSYYDGHSSSRAPSERKRDSLQRKKRSRDNSYPVQSEVRRARSLPRNPAKAPNLMATSLTSSTIWKPDGKCPSFADILKGSLSQDIVESKSEVTKQSITTSTIEEDVKTDKKQYDDLPPTGQRIKSHRNTLPKARQKAGPPPSETLFANNSYDQTKHVESVKVEKENIMIEETVLMETAKSEILKDDSIIECMEVKSLKAAVENRDSSTEDNISMTSQKSNKLNALKSYANILSGGLKKVGSVFKSKSKEEKKDASKQTASTPVVQIYRQNNTEPDDIKKESGVVETDEKVEESISKPSIPGLLFKTELERRPSKKKKKSKSTSSLLEEQMISKLTIQDNINEASVSESQVLLESKILEVMTSEITSKGKIESKSKEGTLKKRSLKKKKSDLIDTQVFTDEIDKALHEIKVLEENQKTTLSRRASRKKKSYSKENIEATECKIPFTIDSSIRNLDFDQDPKQPSYVSANERKSKTTSLILEKNSYLYDFNDNEEIVCLKEDGPSVAHTRISSSLKSLVQCKTENESLHVTSQPKTESKLTNKQPVSEAKQIGNTRSPLTPTAMEKVSETIEIDSKSNNK